MDDLAAALRANPYPGRVVVLARTGDGELVAGYVLTGRSASSRARRMELSDGQLVVRPVGGHEHDALRHYAAALADERFTVFGNGEQVSEVFGRLAAGTAPALALDRLDYEPDPPIFTARVTAVVDRGSGTAWLGAARRSGGGREATDVTVATVRDLAPGDVVLLSTYVSDGHAVRTARSVLDLRTVSRDAEELRGELGAGLDPRFAVALTTFTPMHGLAAARIGHC